MYIYVYTESTSHREKTNIPILRTIHHTIIEVNQLRSAKLGRYLRVPDPEVLVYAVYLLPTKDAEVVVDGAEGVAVEGGFGAGFGGLGHFWRREEGVVVRSVRVGLCPVLMYTYIYLGEGFGQGVLGKNGDEGWDFILMEPRMVRWMWLSYHIEVLGSFEAFLCAGWVV
jgi:hypothetical protein